jgi:hypothetical protein
LVYLDSREEGKKVRGRKKNGNEEVGRKGKKGRGKGKRKESILYLRLIQAVYSKL